MAAWDPRWGKRQYLEGVGFDKGFDQETSAKGVEMEITGSDLLWAWGKEKSEEPGDQLVQLGGPEPEASGTREESTDLEDDFLGLPAFLLSPLPSFYIYLFISSVKVSSCLSQHAYGIRGCLLEGSFLLPSCMS